MKHESLTCPVCGAPFRDVVPAAVAQVQCKYCSGIIIVPSQAPRCPNHPNLLALSQCNDCGNSYCFDCLSAYFLEGEQESGVLNLCPHCMRQRQMKKAERIFLFGIMLLVFGFFAVLIEPILGILCIVFLAVPVLIYSVIRGRRLSGEGAGIFERLEKPNEQGSQLKNSQEIYQGMLVEFSKSYGMSLGSIILENRLKSYMRRGLDREEAVRKLAEDEGYK
jgi:hypothetical protein